ncbi:hypothetical protein EJB05_31002 [Eragrostis curvula]|uniref:Uncharacterized protein n=1 Tax=Eragrostis curvula TaxID=38414 RepID=A0A5J9UCF5_9POAL|nr:hypothetical protein EJB05_31002 [Eragrostis curvula]
METLLRPGCRGSAPTGHEATGRHGGGAPAGMRGEVERRHIVVYAAQPVCPVNLHMLDHIQEQQREGKSAEKAGPQQRTIAEKRKKRTTDVVFWMEVDTKTSSVNDDW